MDKEITEDLKSLFQCFLCNKFLTKIFTNGCCNFCDTCINKSDGILRNYSMEAAAKELFTFIPNEEESALSEEVKNEKPPEKPQILKCPLSRCEFECTKMDEMVSHVKTHFSQIIKIYNNQYTSMFFTKKQKGIEIVSKIVMFRMRFFVVHLKISYERHMGSVKVGLIGNEENRFKFKVKSEKSLGEVTPYYNLKKTKGLILQVNLAYNKVKVRIIESV